MYNVIICLARDQACCVVLLNLMMLSVLTSVGCSQRGEPFLQKLSRNNFNRRQLTLVGSGFVYSSSCLHQRKQQKTWRWKIWIFVEEPVVVANCYRGEVDCILVAENKGDQKSDKVTQRKVSQYFKRFTSAWLPHQPVDHDIQKPGRQCLSVWGRSTQRISETISTWTGS